MCLAVPAQLVGIESGEGVVEWSGMRMRIGIEMVPEARVGDWVLVHTGYAIQVIDAEAAASSLEIFRELERDGR